MCCGKCRGIEQVGDEDWVDTFEICIDEKCPCHTPTGEKECCAYCTKGGEMEIYRCQKCSCHTRLRAQPQIPESGLMTLTEIEQAKTILGLNAHPTNDTLRERLLQKFPDMAKALAMSIGAMAEYSGKDRVNDLVVFLEAEVEKAEEKGSNIAAQWYQDGLRDERARIQEIIKEEKREHEYCGMSTKPTIAICDCGADDYNSALTDLATRIEE